MKDAQLTKEQVARLAETYLAKYQPPDYQILIDRDGIEVADDGWWEIPIHPSKLDAPMFDWSGRSAEAAVDLDETEGVHVLFV